MASLLTHKDLQAVRDLSFCYLCGNQFDPNDHVNHDHVPPESIFARRDRRPLKLRTHVDRNSAHKLTDEKIGQLIGLKRGYVPSNPRNKRLRFAIFPRSGLGAVTNLNIDDVVWRWIRGFHAALYREPFPPFSPGLNIPGSLQTPFPKARNVGHGITFEPMKRHNILFVEAIKMNRARKNIDRIQCNNGRLLYECVWVKADGGRWICVFALNTYEWKDLGDTQRLPSRACVGFYLPPSGVLPPSATKDIPSKVLVPNFDQLDPFGR
jgi:hypothetical protein